MSLEYSLFPGCVPSAREFSCEISARKVLEVLGVELHDVRDFTCCMPACLVHSFDYATGLALTTRNFCVADEFDRDILTLCVSCYGNLLRAKHLMSENGDLRRKVDELLATVGKAYQGKAEVKHTVTALYEDIGLEKLKSGVSKPLKGIRAAPFYGCHLIRPGEYLSFDDTEFPRKLDELIEVTGATSVLHREKAGCCIGCGSFFGGVAEEAALRLSVDILSSAREAGADCVIVTCPYCFLQIEMGQLLYKRRTGELFNLPVLHYTDLLGLSLGIEPKELGLNLHKIDPTPLLEGIK
ncbi:MAG: CoB--CoM heterodisulfide reductase iron-sulfur subunit B family protein [Candidatus Freyarchaeota archaeon]